MCTKRVAYVSRLPLRPAPFLAAECHLCQPEGLIGSASTFTNPLVVVNVDNLAGRAPAWPSGSLVFTDREGT